MERRMVATVTDCPGRLVPVGTPITIPKDNFVTIGCAKQVAGAFSFLLEGTPPADVGMLLDQQGIAVRTGDHCAQPIMKQFGVPGTARASFAVYNTMDEVDRLFAGLEKAKTFLL